MGALSSHRRSRMEHLLDIQQHLAFPLHLGCPQDEAPLSSSRESASSRGITPWVLIFYAGLGKTDRGSGFAGMRNEGLGREERFLLSPGLMTPGPKHRREVSAQPFMPLDE